MITDLLPCAKLPYYMVKGSISKRSNKAEQFVNTLGNETLAAIKDGKIHAQSLQKILDRLLPLRVRVLV